MQTRLDIFKEITLLFISSDYKSMQNVVLKYFIIADTFEELESNDIKRFLYLVYLLTLLKLNEKSEAINSMLFCLKTQKGYLGDLDLQNPIYFILNSMSAEIDIDIYSAVQEAKIHARDLVLFDFINRLPADVLIETYIARASLDYRDFNKSYDEEFISLYNTWLKRGLEQNDTIAHIFYPLNLCQAMARGNTNIDADQFLQYNYYPALESLAFLIISQRMPTIDLKKYFFVAESDPSILDYFSRYFDMDFLTKYQISDALALLHQVKPINLKLNKAIKIIHQHLNLEVENNYCKSKFKMTSFNLFLLPHTAAYSDPSNIKKEHPSTIRKQPY